MSELQMERGSGILTGGASKPAASGASTASMANNLQLPLLPRVLLSSGLLVLLVLLCFASAVSDVITLHASDLASGSFLGATRSLLLPSPSTGEASCRNELQRLQAIDDALRRRRLLQGEEAADLKRQLEERDQELKELVERRAQMKASISEVTNEKGKLDSRLANLKFDFSPSLIPPSEISKAQDLINSQCSDRGVVVSNRSSLIWKGYSCGASSEALQEFFNYDVGGSCPDDWFQVQNLVYVDGCFALPKRRCLNRTPPTIVEPTPFPVSLFSQEALDDGALRWDLHWCKSFECLNTRSVGDCRNCFNMGLEKRRWRNAYRGSIAMKDVIALKNGTLRIGLDAGGGTGSFAAHMARYGVTVMTTAMNIETVKGRMKGLPYMETIALRGLVPLWVPHKSRLPFFDNTLDIIHCVNSIKYLPMLEFEELLFEWDRVLRVGGVLWFEMFYAQEQEMFVYVAIIESLGYKKLHWNVTPKPDFGERTGAHLYLNCVLEKPVRPDA